MDPILVALVAIAIPVWAGLILLLIHLDRRDQRPTPQPRGPRGVADPGAKDS
jgi:hypothetical protein